MATKVNESKIVEKKSPQKSSSEGSEVKVNNDLAEAISRTTAETFKQLQPYLSKQAEPAKVKEDMVSEMNRNFDVLVKQNKEFARRIAEAPRSDFRYVSIPRMFAKYLGSHVLAALNGSTISFPVDGRRHLVYKWFIPAIRQRIDYIDEKVSFMDKTDFSDVLEVDHGDLGT
jgi:hypothetical protein